MWAHVGTYILPHTTGGPNEMPDIRARRGGGELVRDPLRAGALVTLAGYTTQYSEVMSEANH